MKKLNGQIKDMEGRMTTMEDRVKMLEKQNESMMKEMEMMTMRTTKVREGLEGVEGELSKGMEKAKEEVKNDVKSEMREMEDRSVNVVLYGVEESKEGDTEKRKEHDEKKVREMAEVVGVELKGEVQVKFRAGKKNEGEEARPRPMIVKIPDEETREGLFKNARKMSQAPEWRRVFIQRDMTWAQREEGKKAERELKEEAERKTEELKKEGLAGKFMVVGQRDRRRIIRTERD